MYILSMYIKGWVFALSKMSLQIIKEKINRQRIWLLK